MEKVKINGKEFTKQEVYDLACDLEHSILTDDGREICNPTPEKEILESNHVPLRDRLIRVLRQGHPAKERLIKAMSAPPDLTEENDFSDPVQEFDALENQPYQVLEIEPENYNQHIMEEKNNDISSGNAPKTGSDDLEDNTASDGK